MQYNEKKVVENREKYLILPSSASKDPGFFFFFLLLFLLHVWRASRITSELQLYCTIIGALVCNFNVFGWLVPLPHSCSKIGLVPRCRIYVKSPFSQATTTWVSFLSQASSTCIFRFFIN